MSLTPSERHDLDAGFVDLADAAEIEETQAVLDAYAETEEYQTAYEAMLAQYPEE